MNPLTRFKKIRMLPLLIAPALAGLVTFTPAPAHATPGCGFTGTNMLSPVPFGYYPSGLLDLGCESEIFKWELEMKVKGNSDLYVTLNTWLPGGQTGWHTHPGPSLITVIEGTIIVYEDDCTFETYSAGESFTDIGCGDVHNVRNETGAVAKAVAVQIVPHNAPRRIDVPNPGCAQPAPCP